MDRNVLALALYTQAGETARAVEAVAYRLVQAGEAPALPPTILLSNRARFDMCARIANRALCGTLPAPVT